MSDNLPRETNSRLSAGHPGADTLGFLRWLILVPFEGRQRRMAIAELERLDDRMLRDIGILRSEIPEVIDGLTDQTVELVFPTSLVSTSQNAVKTMRKAA
ncbi:DUF1127 domain-containing protein [Mesorhizobium sp. ESP7-2]|uniref:DUF1127 domain-containing protein n=1 Tax=Mesorhizobium sp. ESP7-2 TaxID=2876622 RepID=UPI001CCF93DC|nr:DUF1127 domain-containing protein [Mesorhizobium sp. ESP7-2]MBZ9708575.1 DUF1127 domain-containing protein [Mesorhizobium sp. ESP7-2]